ncbi:MAG: hypothetical protein ABWX90_02910 [Candidatus Saccharimonadales bacterium]
MTESATKTYVDFVLPPSVVSKLDVSRLVDEMERVDNDLTAAAVRAKTGSQAPNELVLSDQLTAFLNQNGLKPASSHERTALIAQLRLLKDKVPVIHMTFAVEADRESLQQLTQWLRSSVHPQAVVAVGLQPALVAGVYLRTPNRVHDLSLRAMLDSNHEVLVKDLEALRGDS